MPRDFFQTSDVARLIGMPERRLIKFVESPGYGIKPSLRVKAGKGAPRLYSQKDVLSIALAWWLFQSGFRSQVIGRVLRLPAVVKTLLASSEWNAETASHRYLIVKREMAAEEPPNQEVSVVELEEASADWVTSFTSLGQIADDGRIVMALYKRNDTWWTDFSVNGQRYRESLDTTDWREAQAKEK